MASCIWRRATAITARRFFLSEFGGIGYVRAEDRGKVPQGSWGYSGLKLQKRLACIACGDFMKRSHAIRQIAGICYTQLYDVEQEVNGLMTYSRQLKFEPAEIRKLNQLLG